MRRFTGLLVLFLLTSSICMAEGSKENTQPTQTQQGQQKNVAYWQGDGGKGMRLAVLEPTGKGLSASENWMPSMIQSSVTGDFQKYSAMTIIDRQNLEKILGEQKQSLSGNYSDADYVRIGKLTNARYVLAGSVTKTANTFMLEMAVTDVESGERKASYPPKAVSPFALENLSAVKEATAELLRQLGIQLTNAGLQELGNSANIAQVKAETALAKGIEAQKQGTTVEALSYFIQASNYNSGLAEAVSRMNILNADISSGNIGQDTRNDIVWRRQWVARLQETETFFANSLKVPQPYYIVYSTEIRQGKVDYQKETTDLSIQMGFYPDYVWAQNINEVIKAVKNGLQTTGRAQVWELDWPSKSIGSPSPFTAQTKNSTSTVVVEIINSEGKSIGKQTVKSPYGFVSNSAVIIPLWQWEGDVVFTAVNANLITDKLTIRITSIDGIAAETAAKQKNISVMPLSEWESILKMTPLTRFNIEYARLIERAGERTFDDNGHNMAISDYTEAIRVCTEFIRLYPNNADNYAKRGYAYYERGIMLFNLDNNSNAAIEDQNKAIADYTQAIRLNPNNVNFYSLRGNAYEMKEDYNKAIADFTQAIRLEPNNAYHYSKRGGMYSSIHDYDKAIADETQAIRIEPNNAIYYCWRGDIYYFHIKDYNKAIADYSQAIRLEPNSAGHYNRRADAYKEAKDYNKAIADYTQVIRLDPDDSYSYIWRGDAYYELKDYNKAIADYTQAIRLYPDHDIFYNRRGDAYYELKDYNKAIADYTQAIRLDPDEADYYNSRGVMYFKINDYNKAINDYEAALRLEPNNATYKQNLDNARKARGR